ncbi:helix-turn-helix domain protein [Actinobacteria bacterium OK074]|nr:helix-turn-helix domain protein [Actinobacteria bacterium OK074]
MDTRLPGSGVRGDKAPLTYTTGEWPRHAVANPDAPVGVHYSLVLARTIADIAEREKLSHRAISRKAMLNPTAVGRIVRGELYPDLATLARLEVALQTDLLPPGLFREARQGTSTVDGPDG